MDNLAVGAALPEDAPGLAALHLASWREAYAGILPEETLAQVSLDACTQQWHRAILSGSAGLALARHAAGPVGFVSFGRCRDADAGDTCGEIWALYVSASHGSQGVGQALWQHACQMLRHEGFDELSLWVLADNERALRFYRRAGLAPDPGVIQMIERGGRLLKEVRYRAPLQAPG